MRLTEQSKYAVMVLSCVGECYPETLTVPEVAVQTGISVANIFKLLKILTKDNLVFSARGRGGGFGLARGPADISVGEVVRACEPRFRDCKPAAMMQVDVISKHPVYQCVDQTIGAGLRAFLYELDGVSIADIARQAEDHDLALEQKAS